MRKRTARMCSCVLGYYHLLSRWSGRSEEEISERRHDIDVIRIKLLMKRGKESFLDISW